MPAPFPGMDPYLEHPVLWESVHASLITAMANQMQPRLDPRYVASIEERVYIEQGSAKRVPDVWIQERFATRELPEPGAVALAEPETDVAVEVDVQELEIHQKRIEILDVYNGMKLIAVYSNSSVRRIRRRVGGGSRISRNSGKFSLVSAISSRSISYAPADMFWPRQRASSIGKGRTIISSA